MKILQGFFIDGLNYCFSFCPPLRVINMCYNKDSGFPSKELDTDLSHSVVQSIRNLVESTLREYTK